MSAVAFRNVVATPSDPVDTWPFEALVETLERGLVPDWQPMPPDVTAVPVATAKGGPNTGIPQICGSHTPVEAPAGL